MDLEKYLVEYNNVTRKELEKIRDSSPTEMIQSNVISLHMQREKEKTVGRPSLDPGPLVHVLSITIQPSKIEDKPLSIYGRIRVEYFDSIYGGLVEHDLYVRGHNVSEVHDMTGTLTLNGPDFLCRQDHAFMPLFRSWINVELFDGFGNVFARDRFSLDDIETEGAYEQVKSMLFPCVQGSLVVNYIAIPLGVHCCVEIMFYNRHVSKKHVCINVNGKIVARCVNTYGNYTSEKCILFKKQANEYERVEFDGKMQLSRCWVALPGYSSLVVGVNLTEFETGRKIVNDTLELLAQPGLIFGDLFVLDDMYIQVRAAWFSPTPLGPRNGDGDYLHEKSRVNVLSSLTPISQERREKEDDREDKCSPKSHEMPTQEIEEMDTEGEDESSSDDELSSNLTIPWNLLPHKRKLRSSSAFEIFSIFIGREKSKALHIFGSIEVLSFDKRICYMFKRDEDDALWLSGDMKSVPILDGSRDCGDLDPLEMKFDIKDVDGILAIKGYGDWDGEVLEKSCRLDKQLCSLIQGQNGFAAMHYSIFERAVIASIKVSLNIKTGSVDVYPKVYGSLISQYGDYDYSSHYHEDYYRCVLFMRTKRDSVQLNADGAVPLSRSTVVVPSYSSVIINVDLSTGISSQKLSCAKEIWIGDDYKTIETSVFFLRIDVDWCEIK